MTTIRDTLAPIEVIDNYGPPSYADIGPDFGRPIGAVVGHTPENPDIFVPSALAVTDWQAGPGNTSGGSYHGVWACKAGTSPRDYRNWVLIRTVAWNRACGGMSRSTNPLEWVRRLAPAFFLRDPNAHSHQMAVSGRSAWYKATPVAEWMGLVVRYAQMVAVLEKAYRYDALLLEHTHMQPPPNRFDISGWFIDVLYDEYQRQSLPVAVPEPAPVGSTLALFKGEEWTAKPSGVDLYEIAVGRKVPERISAGAPLVTLAEPSRDRRVVAVGTRTVDGTVVPDRLAIADRWQADPKVAGGDPAVTKRIGGAIYGGQ